MTRSVCKDNRIRGILQYYGAGRTGRWAGRLLQVQNLPQNHLSHIGDVRELVRARDLETLVVIFTNCLDGSKIVNNLILCGVKVKFLAVFRDRNVVSLIPVNLNEDRKSVV